MTVSKSFRRDVMMGKWLTGKGNHSKAAVLDLSLPQVLCPLAVVRRKAQRVKCTPWQQTARLTHQDP